MNSTQPRLIFDGCKPKTAVASNVIANSTMDEQLTESLRDVFALWLANYINPQEFVSELIDQSQQPQGSTIMRLAMYEVIVPYMVLTLLTQSDEAAITEHRHMRLG